MIEAASQQDSKHEPGNLQRRSAQEMQEDTQAHLHRATAFLGAAKALARMAQYGPPSDLEMKLSRIVYCLDEVIGEADGAVHDALATLDCIIKPEGPVM